MSYPAPRLGVFVRLSHSCSVHQPVGIDLQRFGQAQQVADGLSSAGLPVSDSAR